MEVFYIIVGVVVLGVAIGIWKQVARSGRKRSVEEHLRSTPGFTPTQIHVGALG